ncbi:hypothetical protein ABZY04_31640, partial [Streptomyces sp. NPDC002922]
TSPSPSQGFQGDSGPQGAQGAEGAQGLQGVQGTQGIQGAQGAATLDTYVATGTQGPQSTAVCDAGDVATGGGYQSALVSANGVEQSQPVNTVAGPPDGWQASDTLGALTAYAICHNAS